MPDLPQESPQIAVPQSQPVSIGTQSQADDSQAVGVGDQQQVQVPQSAPVAAAGSPASMSAVADSVEHLLQEQEEVLEHAAPTPAPSEASSSDQQAVAQRDQDQSAPAPQSPQPPQQQAAVAKAHSSYASVLDVLVDHNIISSEQQQQVQMESLSTTLDPLVIVLDKNMVTEEQLVRAKAEYHAVPFVKISEHGTDPQALTQLGESVAKSYKMFPLSYDKNEGKLFVAMVNPLDLQAIDFVKQKTGLNVVVAFSTETEIERALAENYSQSLSNEVTAALEQSGKFAQLHKQSTQQTLQSDTIRQAPVAKIVHTIVSFAMKARSSDIHIEPQETRTRVRYRIDGILAEKLVLPSSVHEAVVSRIKILSGLKIDEKRTPQDGRFNFQEDDQEVDLRVSTLPTIHGEKIVMRLLKKDDNVPDLPDLGLDGLALQWVQKAIKVPHGIILITGPTGSGKTTTLYSILHRINSPKVNIMTLEDPVEYQMKGINQVQVNPQAGLTFASGLRSFLRQDPNIIMVGEIRDSETSELAIQASLTGHLVFSTLHTSSAAGAIPRLLDMGAEPFLLASSMTLVMAQRVMRRINPNFKEKYKPEKVVIDDLKEVLGPLLDQWCKKNNTSVENIELYRPKKEIPQGETAFKGRIAIFEVINISEPISKLILKESPASDIEKLALESGTLLMKQDGYIKALDGITTIEEVKRVAEV